MTRRLSTVAVAVAVVVAVTPGVARAHGIGGRLDLPVPISYFLVGAAIVLVVSFVALAILWPEPRLQDGPRSEPARLRVSRRGPLPFLGVLGLLLVIGQIIPPILGLEPDATRPSLAPVLVWVVFWLVIPFAGVLIGDWYTDINPWRTLARWLRLGRGERVWILERVGVWPATVAFLAFTWLELVSPESGSPTTLGLAALVFTAYLLGASAYAGRETAMAASDVFTPYNRMISAISPLGRNPEGRLIWRGWIRALTVIPDWPGMPAFVVVAIGTVTFDGASGTSWFRDTFGEMGTTIGGGTLLLLSSVAVIGLAYWLASWAGSRLTDETLSAGKVARRFAHTLVPIALAYAVAHYLTLVLFEGQQLFSAVSDPFGIGWDLFGTAERKIDFFITKSEPIWYVQVAVILAGHVLGVILAHDRALADFGKNAVRSQYAMLVLMVALTSLGLLILAG